MSTELVRHEPSLVEVMPAIDEQQEERPCDSHGIVDCGRCAYEERYAAYEEEQGAIQAEEAMFA